MTGLRVTTAKGEFTIALALTAAPHTTGYFVELARSGALDNSSIYRLVGEDNAVHAAEHPIAVLQGGLQAEDPQPIAPIPHEGTDVTQLRHKRWTVSTARFAVGQTYGSFFVCMRDEPVLDHGGMRHPDGLGFAAFGHIQQGGDVVQSIYDLREPTEMLTQPIAIHRVIVA